MRAPSISVALKTPITILSSAKEILSSPRMLMYLVPPYFVGLLVAYVTFFAIQDLVSTELSIYVSSSFSFWPEWLSKATNTILSLLVSALSWMIAGIVSLLIALLAVSVVTAYFIELFISFALHRRGIVATQELSFIKSLLRGLKDESIKIILFSIVGITILVASIFPPLSLIALLLGIYILGYDFYEIPLTLTGLGFYDRLSAILKHSLEVFALGGIFSLISVIPFLPIILLPLGYLTAVNNIKNWR